MTKPRRRRLAIGSAILAACLAAIVVVLAWHYLPYVDGAHSLMTRATALSAEIKALGVADLHTTTVDRLSAEIDSLQSQMTPLQGLLATDPLVGLARDLPLVGPQVRGVDALMTASEELVDAGQLGLTVGRRVTTISDAHGTSAGGGMLPALVSVMATSDQQVDALATHLAHARAALEAIPANAIGTVAHARDQLLGPIDTYGPILAEYQQMDVILPAILGWQAGKRYLVLALDPAELRPTGGYAGTVGTVAFQDGALTERHFFDVFTLDTKPDLPYVEPPAGLKDHLLGDLPWTLADANWSPDFPTSAQDALHLYTLESGDAHIDGVIALTTYALDRLLEVTGPIQVPGYDQVVKAGDVTLTALELTRASTDPATNRKEFLDALANTVLDRLFQLPQESWMPMFQAIQDIGHDRLAMAWFKDPAGAGAGRAIGLGGPGPAGHRRLRVRGGLERGAHLQVRPGRGTEHGPGREPGRGWDGHVDASAGLGQPRGSARGALCVPAQRVHQHQWRVRPVGAGADAGGRAADVRLRTQRGAGERRGEHRRGSRPRGGR